MKSTLLLIGLFVLASCVPTQPAMPSYESEYKSCMNGVKGLLDCRTTFKDCYLGCGDRIKQRGSTGTDAIGDLAECEVGCIMSRQDCEQVVLDATVISPIR